MRGYVVKVVAGVTAYCEFVRHKFSMILKWISNFNQEQELTYSPTLSRKYEIFKKFFFFYV